MAAPDLVGFRGAMQRKRSAFAETVTFTKPAVHVWPAGTPIDPETGLPYDPVLADEASTDLDTVDVAGNVAIRGQEDAKANAAGWFDNTHALVIVDLADQAAVEDATRFIARGVTYEVVVKRTDGLVGVDRYLMYGRKT